MFCWYSVLLECGDIMRLSVDFKIFPPPLFLIPYIGAIIRNSLVCIFPHFFVFVPSILAHIHNCWSYIVCCFWKMGYFVYIFLQVYRHCTMCSTYGYTPGYWMAVTDVSECINPSPIDAYFGCFKFSITNSTAVDILRYVLTFASILEGKIPRIKNI